MKTTLSITYYSPEKNANFQIKGQFEITGDTCIQETDIPKAKWCAYTVGNAIAPQISKSSENKPVLAFCKSTGSYSTGFTNYQALPDGNSFKDMFIQDLSKLDLRARGGFDNYFVEGKEASQLLQINELLILAIQHGIRDVEATWV